MKRFALLLLAVALGAGAAVMTTARPTHAQGFGDAKKLKWELIEADLEPPPRMAPMIESDRQRLMVRLNVYRAKVPGGWLLMSPRGGMSFIADPQHAWSGGSLPR